MMRRAFGGGMGGGGGSNGGGMLRAVQRAVRSNTTISGAAQEPFSHSTTAKTATTTSTANQKFNNKGSSTLSLSSSSSSPLSSFNNLPISVATALAPTWDTSSYNTDESDDWECLDGGLCHEDERVNNILFDDYNNILGPVPSTDEVQHAVSALQQVFEPSYYSYYNKDGLGYNSNEDTADAINLTHEVSFSGSVSDWIEPSMHICNSKLLQSYGSNRVYDAFRLLQTEPSIQKMVISLSSDKAVWNAVLNNEAVREIRDSLKQVDAVDDSLPGSDEADGSDGTVDMISWIFVNTKEKVMEIVEKIIEFVNEWFSPSEQEKTSDGKTHPFQEKLRTSFFLSVVVLLIVVVARAQNA